MGSNKQLDRIEEKLLQVSDTTIRQQSVLEGLTASVAEHIRRTNILEDQLQPIRRHVAMVEGVVKFLGLAALIMPLVGWIYKLVHP